jgi:hypothetical protein
MSEGKPVSRFHEEAAAILAAMRIFEQPGGYVFAVPEVLYDEAGVDRRSETNTSHLDYLEQTGQIETQVVVGGNWPLGRIYRFPQEQQSPPDTDSEVEQPGI